MLSKCLLCRLCIPVARSPHLTVIPLCPNALFSSSRLLLISQTPFFFSFTLPSFIFPPLETLHLLNSEPEMILQAWTHFGKIMNSVCICSLLNFPSEQLLKKWLESYKVSYIMHTLNFFFYSFLEDVEALLK